MYSVLIDMASLPIFLTCVANSTDDPTFPLLFTWSTSDAQIKEVLIIPDDDWLHAGQVEANQFDINESQLYEFGYEASDILAEWNNEFDTDQVLALDIDLVGHMVEQTYDVKGLYPNFEVVSARQWFKDRDVDLMHELNLLHPSLPADLLSPDELIAAFLSVAYNKGFIALEDIEQE